MKKVIGIFGEKGSGKETFTQLLKELLPGKKVQGVRTSEILKQTLLFWNLPDVRENYSMLVTNMERVFGPGTLAKANSKLIDNSDADIIVVDGIRRQPEVDLVKSFPGSILIYLTTNSQVRFERIKARGERENERSMTHEEFIEEESLPTEQYFDQMKEMADLTLENSEDLEEFRQTIHEFVLKYLSA